jgi:hypothetical protein
MLRLTLSYSTQEEKEKFLSDIVNLKEHKVVEVSKGKEKSLYKKLYIDLSQK